MSDVVLISIVNVDGGHQLCATAAGVMLIIGSYVAIACRIAAQQRRNATINCCSTGTWQMQQRHYISSTSSICCHMF
jgi:hypothetical protein